jgi:phage-related protein
MFRLLSQITTGMFRLLSQITTGMFRLLSQITTGMFRLLSQITTGMFRLLSQITTGMFRLLSQPPPSFHRIFNMSYTTGVTNEARTAYPSRASRYTTIFSGVRVVQSLVFCVVFLLIIVLYVPL